MKVMDYIKRIPDTFSTLVKSLGVFLPLKKALIPTNLVYIIHLLFHFIKHFHQGKMKFHLDYYKSNVIYYIISHSEQ